MKRVKSTSTASIILAFATAISFFQLGVSFARPPMNVPEATGKLRGIVVDWQYARVLNTTIVFENVSFKKEIAVDQNGSYEVELPAGTFLATAQSPGFRQFRSKIDVVSNVMKTFNIMLKVTPQMPVKCPRGAFCL